MGIFGDLFDLNNDGNIDCLEQGFEFMLLNDLMNEEDEDEFESAGPAGRILCRSSQPPTNPFLYSCF